ncbi:hypothetical protein STEG23_018260, partial [Scotinomys teguina]
DSQCVVLVVTPWRTDQSGSETRRRPVSQGTSPLISVSSACFSQSSYTGLRGLRNTLKY